MTGAEMNMMTLMQGKVALQAIAAELRAIRELLEGPPPVQPQPNAIDEFLLAGGAGSQAVNPSGQ